MVVIRSKIILAVFLLMLAGACQSPYLIFPGKALRGEVLTVTNFAFASGYAILKLETRPENPYSVLLRVTVIDEQLYIDAAPSRQWHAHIQQNQHVRIQIGDFVYPASAIVVEEPSIQAHFIQGRTIYRVVPSS